MFRFLIPLAATAALVAAVPADAAQYLFSFNTATRLFGPTAAGSGTFTTSNTAMTVAGQTAFQILSISGTVNGLAIVAPTGNYGNYFTTGPSFLDGTGTTFTVTGGGRVDFFNQSSNGLYRVKTSAPGSSELRQRKLVTRRRSARARKLGDAAARLRGDRLCNAPAPGRGVAPRVRRKSSAIARGASVCCAN